MLSRQNIALLAVGVLLVVGAGVAAGSAQPTPMCPVCDERADMWVETRWEPPDESHVRLRAHENGSATWRADLRWDNPDDAPAPDEASMVESSARGELDTTWAFPDPVGVEADVREGATTIRWRTPGAVDDRFGHDVLRVFHGEGTELRLTFTADTFVVEVPPGSVITNDPGVGTVSEDRTSLTIDGGRRSLEDFHVVFGEGQSTASDVTTTLAVGSILWPVMAWNTLVLVVPPTAVLAVGFGGGYAFERRVDALPDWAFPAAGVGSGIVVVAGVGLASTFEFLSATWALAGLAAIAASGYAAAGSRRRFVAAAVLAHLVVVGPMVWSQWPLLETSGFFVLTVLLYAVLAVGFVVFGAPCYLLGLTLARRDVGE